MGDKDEIKRSGSKQNKTALQGTKYNTISVIFKNRRSAINLKHNYEMLLSKYEA